jgi:hypothetical protein
MKFCIRIFIILFVFAAVVACEENAVGPSYKKIGTSTSTNAFITPSTTTPLQGATVVVTMRYVNIESDPAQELVLLVREGATGTFTEVTSFNESSQSLRTEISRPHNYVITQTPGTQLTFRLELHTQKDFPKLVNSSVVTVQLPAPLLNEAQDVTSNGFTISWSQVETAEKYRLDISTVTNFSSKVPGYNLKEITGLSEIVGGLNPATTYYIRVYAVKGTLVSLPSVVRSVTTNP